MKIEIKTTVVNIIILYVFIKLMWLLVFAYTGLGGSHWGIIKHIAVLGSVLFLCKALVVKGAERGYKLFFSKPSESALLQNIPRLFIPYVFVGIGCVAILIWIESNISLSFAIEKWKLDSPTYQSINILDHVFIIHLLISVLLAPLIEEIVFRGLILSRLLSKHSLLISALLSATIFSLFHYNKSYLGTFIHGVILAFIVIKFGSLYLSYLLHAVYNLSIIMLQKYVWLDLPVINKTDVSDFSYWYIEILLGAFGGVLIYIILRYQVSKNSVKLTH